MRRKALTVLILVVAMITTTVFAYAGTSVSRYTGTTYTHSSSFDDRVVINGLDVSIYQGTIDWEKAKADGIDFAIIRVAGRGYGTAGTMYTDDNFKKNIKGAVDAGMLVGIYFFSQAVNTVEAVAEAKYAVKLLEESGYNQLDLPIFMDYEFAGGTSGRLTKANLSKSAATKVAKAFCEQIIKSGYEPGIYANLTFLNNTIDGATLGESYPIWVAQYYSQCNYKYDYDWWQYSSSGVVNGITARNDCNFWYIEKVPTATSDYSIAIADASIVGDSTFTYKAGTTYEPSVAVYYGGTLLTENVDYRVKYIKNAEAGTAYAMIIGQGQYTDYQLVPFTINPSTSLTGITVSKIADMTYTGKTLKPSSIVVTDSAGKTLVNNVDYTYTVSNAVNVGTAKVNITFKGNYSGTKSASYNIVKATQVITVGDSRTQVAREQEPYNLGVSLKFSGAKVTYTSSDTDVATVSSDGTVTVKKQGTTTITIKAAETDNVKSATKTIKLTVSYPQQTVTGKYTLYKKTMQSNPFNLVGIKTNGNGKITYKSSDESVVKVSSSGKATVVGPGTAIITATAAATSTWGEGSFEMKVIVSKGEQTVTTSYTRYKRTDLAAMFNLNVKTNGDGKITYTSSDESVAKIDENGRVTVVGPGVVEFTVKAAETNAYTAGEKIVTLTVSGFESDEARETKKQKIINGVENTKIINVKLTALSKRVRVDWKKQASGYAVDYYQIWRSTKKSSGYVKMFTTSSSKKFYYINTKDVKPSTTYWYKVRGVRIVDGKMIYTPFTKVSVTTKK